MPRFLVTVEERHHVTRVSEVYDTEVEYHNSIWEIEAEDEDDARANWKNGIEVDSNIIEYGDIIHTEYGDHSEVTNREFRDYLNIEKVEKVKQEKMLWEV